MSEWRKENCITMICMTASLVALYALGAGGYSFWVLLFMLNINYPKSK